MSRVSEAEVARLAGLADETGRASQNGANARQVGGSHYRELGAGGEQHWDMMWRLYKEAWFVGNITAYVLRYKKKNGLEDLEKARHYIEKLIELERAAESECQKDSRPQPPPTKTCTFRLVDKDVYRVQVCGMSYACGCPVVARYDAAIEKYRPIPMCTTHSRAVDLVRSGTGCLHSGWSTVEVRHNLTHCHHGVLMTQYCGACDQEGDNT